MSDIHQVHEWLAGGALSGPNSEDVLAQLCQRMVGAGIPLWRAAVFLTPRSPLFRFAIPIESCELPPKAH